MDRDLALALKLQKEYDEELSLSKKKKSFMEVDDLEKSQTNIIDPSLEFTDPTPDVFKMFVAFDKRFFWSSLGSVEVKWSPRMTQCAGICYYKSRGGTSIALSLPLLKLRPRKDLVETLLHEMIHAYLFVTKNDRDRDGHGPIFQSHMHRINKSAGTNITIYHTFHQEVNLYKTHWWRCNGPCQHRKPFYGIVRRSTNRAPGPNDFWYAEHKNNCGGEFIKIKEPENYKSKKRNKSVGNEKVKPPVDKGKKISGFFKPTSSKPALSNGDLRTTSSKPAVPKGGLRTTSGGSSTRTIMTVSKLPKNEDQSGCPNLQTSPPAPSIIPFSGQGHTLGKTSVPLCDKPWLKRLDNIAPSTSGTKRVVQNPGTLNKKIDDFFGSPPDSKKAKVAVSNDKSKGGDNKVKETVYEVSCPVCSKSVDSSKINNHLDECLSSSSSSSKKEKPEVVLSRCAVCNQKLNKPSNGHVLCDVCESGACSSDFDFPETTNEDRSISCPICNQKMCTGDLERHLEDCIELTDSNKNTTSLVDEDEDIFIDWVKPVS